ncbi:hypothetical protein QTL97_17555 [Sporosarcina thermotolerans]|uniref:DUF5659 domain-containing protein n=1 Tax=Sporosarcina thermotolerans TaxID=633404 RepID=A0AAW9ADR2_9BACL|nr:hypothetical protein [Sporosarcina thermotolerans]MDW0118733.1 hypothetical protein [Sporosarcina thermotolerans]WHT48417.1 hypothetical protein QNH10_00730 [Sporosarcina thermotolerans]
MNCESKVKVIYKKSLFVELVKLGHNFLYSTKNKNNPNYQCFMFEATKELDRDLATITGHEYDGTQRTESK